VGEWVKQWVGAVWKVADLWHMSGGFILTHDVSGDDNW